MTESNNAIKNIDKIKSYWNDRPCNIKHSNKEFGTIEYFNEVEKKKYLVEPHIPIFADFKKWKGKKVLEIGCGIGTDSVNFGRHGADYYGIELSDKSLEITKKRFEVFNLKGKFYNINSEENLDFLGLESFDLIYSFGVIHHSPNPDKIIENAYKLLKDTGTLKIMVYAENSWKKIMIDSDYDQYEAQNNCPLAYTYTNQQVKHLLQNFTNIHIWQTHIFPYKIPEYKQNKYVKEDWFRSMSTEMFSTLENKLGWHLCITSNKNK